jgi:hypothetical protein
MYNIDWISIKFVNRDGVVGILTRRQAGRPRNRGNYQLHDYMYYDDDDDDDDTLCFPMIFLHYHILQILNETWTQKQTSRIVQLRRTAQFTG